MQNRVFYNLIRIDDLRLVFEAAVVNKAAEIDHLYLGLAVPFGIAVNVFGDKNHVALADLQLFVEIYICPATLEDNSKP